MKRKSLAPALVAASLTVFTLVPPSAAQASDPAVGGIVYIDSNNNGFMDLGELGYPGATINLYSGPGYGEVTSEQQVTTNADGSYSFTIADPLPAENWMKINVPAGYIGTSSGLIGLPYLGNGYTQDFGLGVPPVLQTVFADDFTGADGTSLTTHNSNWLVYQSMPIIQNNALYDPGPGSSDPVGLPGFNLTDQCMSMDIQFPDQAYTGILTALHSRQQSSTLLGLGYGSDLAYNPGSSHVGISIYKDGGYFNSGNNPPRAIFASAWHSLRMCVIGGQLSTYIDNALVNSAADSTYQGGYVSFGLFEGVPIDNFKLEGVLVAPRRLTALDPANVWIGLKSSDDVGTKFDLLAEVYKDNAVLVSSGQVDSFAGGSSGFNNAHLATIPFNSFAPVDFPTGSQLSVKIYVRNACSGSGHNSGVARLWYNDGVANSRIGATIDSPTNYFLRDAFILATSAGPGPKKTIDLQSGAKCSASKLAGTWTTTP